MLLFVLGAVFSKRFLSISHGLQNRVAIATVQRRRQAQSNSVLCSRSGRTQPGLWVEFTLSPCTALTTSGSMAASHNIDFSPCEEQTGLQVLRIEAEVPELGSQVPWQWEPSGRVEKRPGGGSAPGQVPHGVQGRKGGAGTTPSDAYRSLIQTDHSFINYTNKIKMLVHLRIWRPAP